MGKISEFWQSFAVLVPALIIIPAVATYALIWILEPFLQRYALARPNSRSSHVEPTPQGAGIAVIAVAVATMALLVMAFPDLNTAVFVPVLIAMVILAIVGAIDDIRTLEAMPRLAVQAVAALIVVVALPEQLQILPAIPFWLERLVMLLALLWCVNLVNFMDGIDWMTVTETITLTAALALFGAMGALQENATLTALALCGAMLGFAPLNRPVAKFFLGDVGSLPIGLLLGWLLIQLAANHIAAAMLLPLYYIGDATVTLLRRLVKGEQVMQAHRSHFYQLALSGGLSVNAIIGQVALLNIALIVLAGVTIATSSFFVQIGSLASGCLLVGWQLYRFWHAGPRSARKKVP